MTQTTLDFVDPVIAVHDTHEQAEAGLRTLAAAGIDLATVSLVGRSDHGDARPVGFHTVGERIRGWGGMGGFWGVVWGLLSGPAVFVIPTVGLFAAAGPFGLALGAALEGAVLVAGLSELGTALVNLGLPEARARRYESALQAGKSLLIVHGTPAQIEQARAALTATDDDATPTAAPTTAPRTAPRSPH